MSTYRTSQESSGFGLGSKILAAAVVAGIAAAAYFGLANKGSSSGAAAAVAEPKSIQEVVASSKASGEVSKNERTVLFEAAFAKGKQQAATWPKTEQAMAADFWKAMVDKNMDQVLVLCPGSKKEDFGPYAFFAPLSLGAIGAAEPHPNAPNVKIWPVKVNFQKFPNKTIKMAFFRLPDGRLAVDGQHTIWW